MRDDRKNKALFVCCKQVSLAGIPVPAGVSRHPHDFVVVLEFHLRACSSGVDSERATSMFEVQVSRLYLPRDINLYKIVGRKNQENGIGRARQVH